MDDQQTWQRTQQLLDAFKQLGCDDADRWARSEIEDDIPQLARYRFVSTLWPQMIDSWHDGMPHIPAAQRALDAGVSEDDLTLLARAVAYETVFLMLHHLGAEHDAADELPSWALAELTPAGAATGRHLAALHEDLLALDPSGREGDDLWT